MGSAASMNIPERMDKETCRSVLGAGFDNDFFDRLADESGTLSRASLLRAMDCTDVFLTHDWGKELNQDNHQRVGIINAALKRKGLITWFDDDRMTGNIKVNMKKTDLLAPSLSFFECP